MRPGLPVLLLAACVPPPTWDEVAPVVQARCLGCHGPEGVWPPLHEASLHADLGPWIHEAIATEAMPPWAPDDRAHPLMHRQELSASERRLLLGWFEDIGPTSGSVALRAPLRPTLRADHRFELPEHRVDGESHRCFLVDLPQTRLTAFDVEGTELVHHVLLGVHPEERRQRFEALDAQDAEPGWSCPDAFMSDAVLPPDRVPVLWFPSPGPTSTSPGTGIPLAGVGVLQVHGLGVGKASGWLSITTDDAVAEEIAIPIGRGEVELPEGRESVVVVRKGILGLLLQALDHPREGPVRVLGARGHGHHLLRRLTIDLDGDPILDLVRWDPRIQPRYLLQKPIVAELDQVVTLTCTYETTVEARAEAASYGDEGEMCGGWLFVRE